MLKYKPKMPNKNCAHRPGLYAVGIFTNVLPGTAVKFIIKSSLFLQKFKDAC